MSVKYRVNKEQYSIVIKYVAFKYVAFSTKPLELKP